MTRKTKDMFLLLVLPETIRSSSLVCKSFHPTALAFHWRCDVMQILNTQVTTAFPPSRVYAGSPWWEIQPRLVKYHSIFCWWFVLLTSRTAFSYQKVFTLSSHVYSHVSACSSVFFIVPGEGLSLSLMPLTFPSSRCPCGRSDSAECTGQNNSHPVVTSPSCPVLGQAGLPGSFFSFFSFLLTHSKKAALPAQ